jgi:hypothetical protein
MAPKIAQSLTLVILVDLFITYSLQVEFGFASSNNILHLKTFFKCLFSIDNGYVLGVSENPKGIPEHVRRYREHVQAQ